MLDYNENKEAIERIREVDEKLHEDIDGKTRTKLMFEQMLRGLYLNNFNQNV